MLAFSVFYSWKEYSFLTRSANLFSRLGFWNQLRYTVHDIIRIHKCHPLPGRDIIWYPLLFRWSFPRLLTAQTNLTYLCPKKRSHDGRNLKMRRESRLTARIVGTQIIVTSTYKRVTVDCTYLERGTIVRTPRLRLSRWSSSQFAN